MLRNNDSSKFTSDYLLISVDTWIKLTGLFLLLITWGLITTSFFIKYNVTVKGLSQVRPVGGTKLVESQKSGIIENISVVKNQLVNRGDIIATLDSTDIAIQKKQLMSNIEQKLLKIKQIDTQIELLNQQTLAEDEFLTQEILIAEMELNQVEKETYRQKISTGTNLQEIEASFELAKNEIVIYEKLFEEWIVSELELQEKRRNLKIAEARLMNAQATTNIGDNNINIAQTKITQLINKRITTLANLNREKEALLRERLEMETLLREEQKNLEKIERELEKSLIRSSATGVILELHLRNEQQFVDVNDVIAEILPQDVDLIINTLVSNQDIDKVVIGQSANLQINACPHQEFGTLSGIVTQISPDANGESYFEVIIKPKKLSLDNGKVECTIKSGMKGKANIISRQETFLEFVLRKTRLLR